MMYDVVSEDKLLTNRAAWFLLTGSVSRGHQALNKDLFIELVGEEMDDFGRDWMHSGHRYFSFLSHAALFSVLYFTFSRLAIFSLFLQTSVGFVISAVTTPPIWIGVYGVGVVASSVGSSPNMREAQTPEA